MYPAWNINWPYPLSAYPHLVQRPLPPAPPPVPTPPVPSIPLPPPPPPMIPPPEAAPPPPVAADPPPLSPFPLAPVPIGGHRLPPLPYQYDSLEPFLAERTMIIHHQILHRGYVDKLNKVELQLQQARTTGNYESIRSLERDVAYYGAAHYLHTLFWETMYPGGTAGPSSAFRKQLEADYGSLQNFRSQFSWTASAVEMSGWAILCWSPRAHRTAILLTDKHPKLTQWESIPLLALDMAEHAYFLQYTYHKEDYIDSWWQLVNWPEVEQRWRQAREVRWQPW